jgi:predicted FMN-binding regulatory protein PaiB
LTEVDANIEEEEQINQAEDTSLPQPSLEINYEAIFSQGLEIDPARTEANSKISANKQEKQEKRVNKKKMKYV